MRRRHGETLCLSCPFAGAGDACLSAWAYTRPGLLSLPPGTGPCRRRSAPLSSSSSALRCVLVRCRCYAQYCLVVARAASKVDGIRYSAAVVGMLCLGCRASCPEQQQSLVLHRNASKNASASCLHAFRAPASSSGASDVSQHHQLTKTSTAAPLTRLATYCSRRAINLQVPLSVHPLSVSRAGRTVELRENKASTRREQNPLSLAPRRGIGVQEIKAASHP